MPGPAVDALEEDERHRGRDGLHRGCDRLDRGLVQVPEEVTLPVVAVPERHDPVAGLHVGIGRGREPAAGPGQREDLSKRLERRLRVGRGALEHERDPDHAGIVRTRLLALADIDRWPDGKDVELVGHLTTQPGDRSERFARVRHRNHEVGPVQLRQRQACVLERRDDAEISAAAAERPQQLRIAVGAGAHHGAVRGHDLGCNEAVARESVRAQQVPDAAGQREPGDPGVDERPAGRREPVDGRGGVDVEPLGATLGAGEPTLRVDLDRAHVPQVDDEGIVRHAVPGDAVAAAADSDRQPGGTRRADCGDHVGSRPALHDDRRAAIDHAVERQPRLVVAVVPGAQDPGVRPELRERVGGHRVILVCAGVAARGPRSRM